MPTPVRRSENVELMLYRIESIEKRQERNERVLVGILMSSFGTLIGMLVQNFHLIGGK